MWWKKSDEKFQAQRIILKSTKFADFGKSSSLIHWKSEWRSFHLEEHMLGAQSQPFWSFFTNSRLDGLTVWPRLIFCGRKLSKSLLEDSNWVTSKSCEKIYIETREVSFQHPLIVINISKCWIKQTTTNLKCVNFSSKWHSISWLSFRTWKASSNDRRRQQLQIHKIAFAQCIT